MSLRKEIDDLDELSLRDESPLDPGVYEDEAPQDNLSTSSTAYSSSSSSSGSGIDKGVHSPPTLLVYPFTLPLQGDEAKKRRIPLDGSCSLLNIWSILVKAVGEAVFFGFFLLLPGIIAYMATESSWYNFIARTWDTPFALFTPVMEFYRMCFFAAVIYSIWVLLEAASRIVPLAIRRSWHLLNIPLPNAVKTVLAGWKAARSAVTCAVFGLLALVTTNTLVFGGSRLLSSASQYTSSTLAGVSRVNEWTEKALLAATTLSLLLLGQKILMQSIIGSYRKQALAPRILASNFRFKVLTRLFRQTNLGDADARRSITREQTRSALHPVDEEIGVVEISKDMAGVHLTSQTRAQEIATALWARVCPASRNYLVIDDFRPYFTATDAPEAFQVFDVNGTGIVNTTAWSEAVINIWSERRNLQSSVRMSDLTLGALEGLINLIMMLIWSLSVLGCISPRGYTFLTSSAGFLFAFGFLFKDSCERVFKSFIFVLVEHPFDIGDAVIIDKTKYTVVGLKLFVTTLSRSSDGTLTYIPNSNLVSKYIYNEQRSGITVDSMLVTLPSSTSLALLGELQGHLNSFMAATYASYTGTILIHPIEVQESKMNIRIECKFQDDRSLDKEVKVDRKELISSHIQNFLKDKGIIV